MSVKINAGDDAKRGDRFFVNPSNVVVMEELRGRHTPPTEEQIVERALSMLEHGQIQAVSARRDEQNRLVIVAGFTRTAAARLIRHGFTVDGQEYKDESFMLQVVLSDCNDEEAFKRNIVENAHRNETSPIDDAHNQRRLRDTYGMTDAEIGRLYGYKSPNKVGNYRKLLLLTTEEQQLVHCGTLAVSAALDLLDAPIEHRTEIVEAATNEGGKVSGSTIREQVREHILSDGDGSGVMAGSGESEEPSKTKPRSMREIKRYLQDTIDGEETPEEIKNFCNVFLKYIEGKKTTRQLDNAFRKVAA